MGSLLRALGVTLALLVPSCSRSTQDAAQLPVPPGPPSPGLPQAPPAEPIDRDNPVSVPTVQSVTPDNPLQPTGSTLTFSAMTTGEVTGWRWEFGEGASPATSTDASPVITLGRRGLYTGHVWARNAGGESVPLAFTYGVEERWITFPLSHEINAMEAPQILLLADRPLLLATHGFIDDFGSPEQETRALHARVPLPQTAEDWELLSLDAWASTAQPTGPGLLAAATSGDQLVLLSVRALNGWFCGVGYELVASVARDADPLSEAQFASGAIEEWDCELEIGEPQVAIRETGLLVAYTADTTGLQRPALQVATSSTLAPSSLADWRKLSLVAPVDPYAPVRLATGPAGTLLATGIFPLQDGRPNRDDLNLWVAQTTADLPSAPAEWSSHVIDRWTGDTSVSTLPFGLAASADGSRLCLAWTAGLHPRFGRARLANPRSAADWAIQDLGSHYRATAPQLFAVDNLPLLAFADTLTPLEEWPGVGEFVVLRALTPGPADASDWRIEHLPGVWTRGIGYAVNMARVGNEFLAVYGDPAEQNCFVFNGGGSCWTTSQAFKVGVSLGM